MDKFKQVLIILTALSILTSSCLFYQNRLLQKQIVILQSKPAVSPLPTADLNIFPIPTLGFSIKIPNEIDLMVIEGKTIRLFKSGPTQREEAEIEDGLALFFSKHPLGEKTLENLINEKAKNDIITKIIKPMSKITLNQINGYTYTTKGFTTSANLVYYFFELPDGQNYIQIIDGSADPTTKTNFREISMQILSTFKFLD
ncbi:hypothetical protein COX09_02675 [Candidatus Beckwithbacteria bacterium CG23_combo_of_CG06-09_8_20_14_all_47_9]|uniref:PsbP C-terminal domain-containing protein n=2 Tax=Microgenomates group TaxID=1794810 RepID=A0A2H0B3L0_9BACT|nr:MAG: hypothetical protein COX09_02675 [Candidatus Beckwithbacteria bacterium CG23_combo_of_CG06-09_8_20_14_all_47_9]PIU37058.1 MAG: hypothetical protein COT02_02825 [Candidatus Roizmanbacteria bacterium CG07_land_8_20_14_0_80_34_15]